MYPNCVKPDMVISTVVTTAVSMTVSSLLTFLRS